MSTSINSPSLLSLPGRALVRISSMIMANGLNLKWADVRQQLVNDLNVALITERDLAILRASQVQEVLTQEQRLLAMRHGEAEASEQGVLIHDQRRPKRKLLFTLSLDREIPGVTEKNASRVTGKIDIDGNSISEPVKVMEPGTGVLCGSPQKPFQPSEIVISGTDKTTAEGGTRGLLITSIFVGADLQMVNVPGNMGGIPVEYFDGRQPRDIIFDAAYPAIGITFGISNPTKYPVKEMHITMSGKTVS